MVKRILADDDGREHLLVVPYAFDPETDEIALGESCGGGHYQCQARDHNGRFLAGVKAARVMVDGDPRPFSPPGRFAVGGALHGAPAPQGAPIAGTPAGQREVREEEAQAARASEGATVAVRAVSAVEPAGVAVPLSAPLPGMPSAYLDFPGIPAEARALMMWQLTLNAQAMAAVNRYADREAEAAQRTVTVAIELLRAGGTARAGDSAALLDALASERARVTSLESSRAALELEVRRLSVEVEGYRQRERFGAPPREAPTVLGTLEAVAVEAIATLGVPAVAGVIGVDPEALRKLADHARAERTGRVDGARASG